MPGVMRQGCLTPLWCGQCWPVEWRMPPILTGSTTLLLNPLAAGGQVLRDEAHQGRGSGGRRALAVRGSQGLHHWLCQHSALVSRGLWLPVAACAATACCCRCRCGVATLTHHWLGVCQDGASPAHQHRPQPKHPCSPWPHRHISHQPRAAFAASAVVGTAMRR